MSDVTGAPLVPAPAPAKVVPTIAYVDDTPHDKRVFWLGCAILFVVFVIVLSLFFVTIPAENKDVLNTVIGVVVGSGFGSVVGFYYGSSQSSKAKDETITNLTQGS